MDAVPFASLGEWQEIFALLDIALELDAASQRDWLAALGSQHLHLSPMLAHLLQVHARMGTDDFLQPPPACDWLDEPAPASLARGSLVGAYRLLREIGQGGMASVWPAERADGLLDRRVALKLPPVRWGAASFADRMARERNILASLTHPHIARL